MLNMPVVVTMAFHCRPERRGRRMLRGACVVDDERVCNATASLIRSTYILQNATKVCAVAMFLYSAAGCPSIAVEALWGGDAFTHALPRPDCHPDFYFGLKVSARHLAYSYK